MGHPLRLTPSSTVFSQVGSSSSSRSVQLADGSTSGRTVPTVRTVQMETGGADGTTDGQPKNRHEINLIP